VANPAYDLWRSIYLTKESPVDAPLKTDTPAEVHITIDRRGWNLTNVEPNRLYNVYPSQHAEDHSDPEREVHLCTRWSIGPVEVARILERLGIRVRVTVERSV
jgi:precorrin-6B methylase 1